MGAPGLLDALRRLDGRLPWRQRAARRTVLAEALGRDEAARRHEAKVARVVDQLRAYRGAGPVSLRKRAVAHQVPKRGDLRRKDAKIDISDLTSILEIDPERRICVAESGVTFVDLVAATMRYGLVPIVVPELETITIGGAVAGCSIESMSYRFGGFHDTCLEYEVITATGEVLTCTPDNDNSLIFQMVHGAFGTLGIISKLTFRLVPAKPYVRVRYERYGSFDDYMAAIRRVYDARDALDVDFMDGIIHSPTECILSLGTFVDEAPYVSDYRWVKIYYESTRRLREDYLKTPDYFFRYNRGVTNVRPRALPLRVLFGWYLDSTKVLKIADRLNWLLSRDRPTVTLDVFLPISRAPGFLRWYTEEFGYFPLWCVPYRRVRDYEWIADKWFEGMEDPLFVDLAVYGMRQERGKNAHRIMEKGLIRHGGIKTLIAHNYYDEAEFWTIWNQPNYAAVKARTDPRNLFRDLYAKTCKAARGVE